MDLRLAIREIEFLTKSKISVVPYPNSIRDIKLPYCYYVKTQLHGRIIEAWGTDLKKDLAVTKAVMELLERIFFSLAAPLSYKQLSIFGIKKEVSYRTLIPNFQHPTSILGNTSSGIAIHQSNKKATINALNELIERHVILKAFNSHIIPRKTQKFYLPQSEQLRVHHKINISFFFWRGPLRRYISVLRIGHGEFPGHFYAFGCGEKLQIACQKAYFEGTGMILSLLGKKQYRLSVSNPLHKIQNTNLVNQSYYLDNFFSDDETTYTNNVDIHLKYSDFYTASITNILGISSKFHCMKVISPQMQPLFIDKWKDAHINYHAMTAINPEIKNEYSIIC